MRLEAKICGLSTPETIAAAVEGGADMVGFVFYPRSPRAVTPARAADLARAIPSGIHRCGLFVDPDDRMLDQVLSTVGLDLLQLHGSESPERTAAIRQRFGRPVMKAIGVATADDVAEAARWIGSVDRLLFDAKPPRTEGALPGGNGVPFDWQILAGRDWPVPWMLSGGLNAGNVAEALRITGAPGVDVSSAVETGPGIKDPALIRAFLAAARAF